MWLLLCAQKMNQSKSTSDLTALAQQYETEREANTPEVILLLSQILGDVYKQDESKCSTQTNNYENNE